LLAAGWAAKDRSPGLWLSGVILLLGVGGITMVEFYHRDTGTLARIEYLDAHPEQDTRAILHRETEHMIRLHPWLGWGGGSYRYVSPDFFIEDYAFLDPSYIGGLSVRSDWAHSDYLQLLMEFGIIGASLVFAMLLYLYARALWLAKHLHAAGLVVLVACAGMLAHGTVDFPMYNAPVVSLFFLLLGATLKLAELEARRAARA
jgi:O-antigen ligase